MSELSVLEVDGHEVWDNTKLQAYACEMRGKLGYEEHLVRNESSEALAFGAAMHKAVEVWTLERIAGKGEAEAVEAAISSFIQLWEKLIPEDARAVLEINADRRSVQNFKRLFKGYREKFPVESYTKVIGCEVPFSYRLGTTPNTGVEVYWSGVLDRAVEWMEGTYYRDTKTTSYSLDDDFFEGFRLSGQLTGYIWAGQIAWGLRFAGAVVEGIQVQGELKTKKKDPKELIAAEVIPITQEAVEEWRLDTLLKIERIHAIRASQRYTLNRGDLCTKFRGGCAYRPICNALPANREQTKATLYRKRIWNPLSREEMEVSNG